MAAYILIYCKNYYFMREETNKRLFIIIIINQPKKTVLPLGKNIMVNNIKLYFSNDF